MIFFIKVWICKGEIFGKRDLSPNVGLVNNEAAAKAKEAGFVMGITTQNGAKINLDDLMQIPRIRVNHLESLEKFEKILNEAISK